MAAVAEAARVVLEKQIRTLEKRESRLKAAFQERISAFREACYSMFGYRIDMTTEAANNNTLTTFLLRPMHVEEESSYLAFACQNSATGGQGGGPLDLTMQTTAFSETMQREVDMFVNRYKSIPAFLSNLTMDIFQKQTQC